MLAAAEQQSFRRAARTLSVQASTLSRRIRDMEDEIGVALFLRESSGVKLTVAGEKFVRQARKAFRQLTYAVQDAGDIGRGQSGVVRIGLMSSMASGFISELVDAYSLDHGDVHLEYVEGDTSELVAAIQQHRIDIAFVTGTPLAEGCDCTHLWSEGVYVAMASGHELSARTVIAWGDLQDREFVLSEAQSGGEIYEYLVKHLAELGHSPRIQRHAVYRDTLMQVVAKGGCLTLTSEATTATQFRGVIYRQLVTEKLPFSGVWSPVNDNPAFRRLLSLARTVATRWRSTADALQPFADEQGGSNPIVVDGALQTHDSSQ